MSVWGDSWMTHGLTRSGVPSVWSGERGSRVPGSPFCPLSFSRALLNLVRGTGREVSEDLLKGRRDGPPAGTRERGKRVFSFGLRSLPARVGPTSVSKAPHHCQKDGNGVDHRDGPYEKRTTRRSSRTGHDPVTARSEGDPGRTDSPVPRL